ncbi:MAG: hypothetical protein JST75_12785 [Bacteroidetes bacterium]|nr:hypothetical protein [Bacteroidota bacterium]
MFLRGRALLRKKTSLYIIGCLISCVHSFAAIKTWTGNGTDGQWSNPVNWNNGTVPVPGDDVLLDNTIVLTDYVVTLPNSSTIIKTITINPDNGRIIQLVLPSSNIVAPALSATGPGYGILINRGGIFQNASGLTSGESLNIADSIRINNGGKYIHRTRASHANNITRILSSSPGTENGIFEFDVPRASYTVSVSNRIYGSITFSSVAAGGAITYTCTGSNTLTVNGNMQINAGVTVSVDLAGANGNIICKGDYIQQGGTLNLASGAGNSTVMHIRGNLVQSVTGQITETNTGIPFIELDGSTLQLVSLAGTINNSVGFRMNNVEGAILLSRLQLPYKLELLKGKITSSATNMLTLQNNCSIIADSINSNMAFVDGPLRKEGLFATQFFLFPVGKNNLLRWVELKNVSGNFVVEYLRDNPRVLSNSYGAGVAHISSTEYWMINADATPAATGNLELSFVVPGSGGITDPAFLNVASLSLGIWEDAGHTSVTGTFNSAGSVVSNPINNFSATGYFTLASTADLQNPLPIGTIDFAGEIVSNIFSFNWEIDMPEEADSFQLMLKSGNDFKSIAKLPAIIGKRRYSFTYDSIQDGINFFRLRVIDKYGVSYFSKIISINNSKSDFTISVAPTIIAGSSVALHINAPRSERLQWLITAMDGKIMKIGFMQAEAGSNSVTLQLPRLAPGIYQLVAVNEKREFYAVRFVKQ